MSEMEEHHPIYKAIDTGGGQSCDVRGVIRELHKAGFVIVPREPTEAMLANVENNGTYLDYQAMIDEALR